MKLFDLSKELPNPPDWVKKITGLDVTKHNGFSILGDWMKDHDCPAYYSPGLFISCVILPRGNYYRLWEITTSFEIKMIQSHKGNKGWAPLFWPAIQQWMEKNSEVAEEEKLPGVWVD